MWTEFLSWLGGQGEVDLYCWGSRIPTIVDALVSEHSQIADRMTGMQESLVDLRREITGQLYLPVTDYSFKAVADYCGVHRTQETMDRKSAMVHYLDWLRSGEEQFPENLRHFNRDNAQMLHGIHCQLSDVSPIILIP